MTESEFETIIATEGRAHYDRKLNAALVAYSKNHPSIAGVGKRLDDLEEAIRSKDRELQAERLRHYAYRRSIEAGIDPDLLNGYALESEPQVEEAVLRLSKALNAARAEEARSLFGQGPRPIGAASHEHSAPVTIGDYASLAAKRLKTPT